MGGRRHVSSVSVQKNRRKRTVERGKRYTKRRERGERGAYALIEIKTTTNVLDRVLDSLPGWTDRRDLLGCEGLEGFGDQVRLSSDHRFPTLSVHDVRRVSIIK